MAVVASFHQLRDYSFILAPGLGQLRSRLDLEFILVLADVIQICARFIGLIEPGGELLQGSCTVSNCIEGNVAGILSTFFKLSVAKAIR